MASVASQLIEEVTAHAQSDSLEDAREICADDTFRTTCVYVHMYVYINTYSREHTTHSVMLQAPKFLYFYILLCRLLMQPNVNISLAHIATSIQSHCRSVNITSSTVSRYKCFLKERIL